MRGRRGRVIFGRLDASRFNAPVGHAPDHGERVTEIVASDRMGQDFEWIVMKARRPKEHASGESCGFMNYGYHDFMKQRRAQNSRAGEEYLQITVPKATKKSLKMMAARTGDPMRLIILRALAQSGIKVPQKDLHDRRKSG